MAIKQVIQIYHRCGSKVQNLQGENMGNSEPIAFQSLSPQANSIDGV